MYLLYDLVLLASAAALVPYYLYRGWRFGKTRRGIRERIGYYQPDRLLPLAGRPVIWIHAVSVGETRAAIPLIKALRRAFPGHALVLSNVTETGHAVAGTIREIDLCLFFPFDLSWAVRKVLRQVRPVLVIIVETEIWPNFVRLARKSGSPVVLVNGRISDRSYPRYLRLRPLLRPVLEDISAYCMQTVQDAERIRRMGAPAQRIEVTRNLKFDMPLPEGEGIDPPLLRGEYRLPAEVPVWAAGSTHEGEEEAVARVYGRLVAEGKKVVLVLVPRHPERARAVADSLASRGFSVTLRTRLGEREKEFSPGEILVVDTLGEMLKIYAAADLVFLGGSLVPVGGHNVLEAALVRRPVVFGPHMHNFREIARLLLAAGGGVQVEDGEEGLHGAVSRLLGDPQVRLRMGEAGYGLLRQNAGATENTLFVLQKVMREAA